jgi:hypothetical protein
VEYTDKRRRLSVLPVEREIVISDSDQKMTVVGFGGKNRSFE